MADPELKLVEPVLSGQAAHDADVEVAARRLMNPANLPTLAPLSLADVERAELSVAKWLQAANREAAEQFVEQGLAEVHKAATVGKLKLVTPAMLAEANAQLRTDYDRTLYADGAAVDVALDVLNGRIRTAVSAAQELPQEDANVAGEGDRLVAALLEILVDDQLLASLHGKTPGQVLGLYQAADMTTVRGRLTVRAIERQAATGFLSLSLQSPSVQDVVTADELHKTIANTRQARVPEWLQDAQKRIDKLRTNLTRTETLRLLRSGRSIAQPPGV